MKIIITGDLHAKEGVYLNVCLDYLDFVKKYAIENNIDTIVFVGDILEKASKLRYETFTPLFKKYRELSKDLKLYFILGNHDIFSLYDNSSLLETFEDFGTVISSPETINFDGVDINLVPYTNDEMYVPTVGADYLFTHLDIATFDLGNNTIATQEMFKCFNPDIFSNYKKVYTGHYHKRQEKGNIKYVGSPYQLTFSDVGQLEKGFDILDTGTGKNTFVKYTGAPNFVVYEYNDLVDKIKNKKITKEDTQNNFLKIKINEKIEGFSKLKTELFNDFNVIDIKPDFTAKVGLGYEDDKEKIEIDKSVTEMLKQFVSEKKITFEGTVLKNERMLRMLEELTSEI